MKVKITGNVKCLKCGHECSPSGLKDLSIENAFLKVVCENCNHVMVDFTEGNFLISDIKADELQMIG